MTERPSPRPSPNPLVVPPEHEDAQLLNWEGAGVAASWSDLHSAVTSEHVDPAEVAFTAAGAGLSTLGAVLSPLDGLLQAGIGWLIEHVRWLHEPLDALAGDPTQIVAQARTWHNVGGELASVAGEYQRSIAAFPGWEGAAGDGYRALVERFGTALERSAHSAAQLADLVLTTGAQVGTVRALVRDAIAGFVSEAVQVAALMGVAALFTAGGGLGAAALHIIGQAIALAEDIVRWVRRLLDSLTLAGATAAQLSGAIQQTAAGVRAAIPTMQAIDQAADDLRVDTSIEAGKQITKAEQEQRSWGPAPA